MVIVGVLLILAVALDAARRVRSERYSRVRIKLAEGEGEEEPVTQEDEQLFWPRELPNGGARVISRGDLLQAAADTQAAGEVTGSSPAARPATAGRVTRSSAGSSRSGMATTGRDSSRVDTPRVDAPRVDAPGVDAPRVDAPGVDAPRVDAPGVDAPGVDAPGVDAPGVDAPGVDAPGVDTPGLDSSSDERARVETPDVHKKPGTKTPPPQPAEDSSLTGDEVELITGMSALDELDTAERGGEQGSDSDEPQNLDWLDALEVEQSASSRAAQRPPVEGRLPRGMEPEVFMLNVVSRKAEGFRGEDILHILLACDLRFGDMNFFHRHEFEKGRGAIQFSVADMMQPGVFDIDNMAEFTTPGLVFFVTLPGPEDMMKAFDYMLETAQAVARNLDGDVLDESRSVITRQTLEHNRQQIRDLERRMLAKAPH